MCPLSDIPMPRLSPLVLSLTLSTAAFPAAALDSFRIVAPGASDDLADKLGRASLIKAARDEDRTTPQDLLAAARADYRAYVGALYSEGYYNGTVNILIDGREAADIPPLEPPAQISRIEVRVNPGQTFTFGEARVAPIAPETDLPDGFAPGEPAYSELVSDAGKAAVKGWRAVGFAKADVPQQQVTANHAARRLDVRLGVDPGPRLTFGELRISGNKRVRTERIREIAGLPTGEVFDPDELDLASERLRRAGAFRSVSLSEAEEVAPGNVLPIDAALIEEKRRRLGFGAELSSVDGATLSTYWLHRNLLGGAERLRIDGEIAQIGGDEQPDFTLSARFTRPATFQTDTDLYVLGTLAREREPNYDSDSFTFGAGLTRIVTPELTLEAGALFRTAHIDDAFGERDYTLIAFPITAEYDKRNDELNPTGGYYIDLGVQPLLGLSDTPSGAQITADARAYYGFGKDDRAVVAGRLQFGSLVGPDLNEAPPDYLFYAGGGGSVRGFPYQELGVEVDDETVGGRSFIGASAELRGGITDALGLVGFVDTAYIGANSWIDDEGSWITGAGIGVRYQTGLGPIRFDIATPVSGGDDDISPYQIYIGIGQAF